VTSAIQNGTVKKGIKEMRTGFRHFGLVAGAAGLMVSAAQASVPTFALKLGGINGKMFRNKTCGTDADCPTGSECVITSVGPPFALCHNELRCGPIADLGAKCSVGGADCIVDADCGAGTCEVARMCFGGTTPQKGCTSAAECGGGGTCENMVQPGDDLAFEAFLSGWDQDLLVGKCNGDPILGTDLDCESNADCIFKHCEGTTARCQNAATDCVAGVQCVPDVCIIPFPRLGSFQWTIDPATYASTTSDGADPLAPEPLECSTAVAGEANCGTASCCVDGMDNDSDGLTDCNDPDCALVEACACHHGSFFDFHCTCFQSTCSEGACDILATAYFETQRCDYLYTNLAHDPGIFTQTPFYNYSGASLTPITDPQTDRYVGSLWLMAPETAAGRYEVDFVDNVNFTVVLTGVGALLPPPVTEPAIVHIEDLCEDVVCPPPSNVCLESVCQSGDCTERPVVCELEHKCVVAEGGCQPAGACCRGGNCGDFRTEQECIATNGTWTALGVKCFQNPCAQPPDCGDGATFDWANAEPPDFVVDAREPRDVNNGTTLKGINTIVVELLTGDASTNVAECWGICESAVEGAANSITNVNNAAGTYTITLGRRITPGAITTVTYTPTTGAPSTGTFISLPADSDASETSEIADLDEHIQCCLNQACTPFFGEYSCDLNHSTDVTSEDTLRLLDLLSGSGSFLTAWEGESPEPGCD